MKTPVKIFAFCALFILVLAIIILTSGWYEPARLVISGNAETTDTVIDVQWDSGGGYNGYEQRRFHFLPLRGAENKPREIVITKKARVDEKDVRNRVLLTEIRIDNKGVSIPAEALENVRYARKSGWFFDSAGSRLTVHRPISQNVQITFSIANRRGGLVNLSIGGVEVEHDLHRSNWEVLKSDVNFWLLDEQGNFTLTFDLPRYEIDLLKITAAPGANFSSISLESKSGRIELPFARAQDGLIELKAPNSGARKIFHPLHFTLQIGLALLLSALLWGCGRIFTRSGNVRDLLVADSRWLFWAFLFGCLAVYWLWLLAFWPGVMSVDSLNIWRAAQFPEMTIRNHPVINEFYYLTLQLIWNNIAIVPITQIFLVSLLIAAAFFFIFRAGVKLRWLLPCYLLVLFSIPVGLYNLALWKDVPFALLVVFWGLLPAWLYFRKKQGRPVQLGVGRIILLLISFMALLLFRHNGMIYLFVLPLLFLGLGLVKLPRWLLGTGVATAILLVCLVAFVPSSIPGGSYFNDLSRVYLQEIETETPLKRLAHAASAYPRILDIKKNWDLSDLWQYYLGDRYAYSFLLQAGWFDAYPYLSYDEQLFPNLRKFGYRLYEMSLEYPWVYLSWYPFWVLHLFLLSIILCRWLPLSAIFSTVILVQVFALLLFVGTVNWRYYYFLLLGGYFLLPLCLLDLHNLRSRKAAG